MIFVINLISSLQYTTSFLNKKSTRYILKCDIFFPLESPFIRCDRIYATAENSMSDSTAVIPRKVQAS